MTIYNYHYNKWLYILRNNPIRDSRVQTLRNRIRNLISYEQFASIMADLYAVTSKSIHFPVDVHNISVQEIVQVFEEEFQYIDFIQKRSLEIIVSGL